MGKSATTSLLGRPLPQKIPEGRIRLFANPSGRFSNRVRLRSESFLKNYHKMRPLQVMNAGNSSETSNRKSVVQLSEKGTFFSCYSVLPLLFNHAYIPTHVYKCTSMDLRILMWRSRPAKWQWQRMNIYNILISFRSPYFNFFTTDYCYYNSLTIQPQTRRNRAWVEVRAGNDEF